MLRLKSKKQQSLLFALFRDPLAPLLAALAFFLSASPAYSLTFVSASPGMNEMKAATNVKIVITFAETIDPSAKGNIFIHGDASGFHAATSVVSGTKITFTPDPVFTPGEKVTVTLKSGNGISLSSPETWQFSVATPKTGVNFIDSGKSLGNSDSTGTAIGDFNGDGKFDVFVANAGGYNGLLMNDGQGNFTDFPRFLGSSSKGIAVGDLDGDGDSDAFAIADGPGKVWINENGNFRDSQSLAAADSRAVALADADGDGDLDAFVANYGGSKLWQNQGNGIFSDSGQDFGTTDSNSAAFGDVDNDGDLDLLVANNGANEVWNNQGNGTFLKSGQDLGTNGDSIALGDLNADKYLDVFIVSDAGNSVWTNQKDGTFADSMQSVGSAGEDVALGDIEGDGDLDAFIVNCSQAHTVWLNDGKGNFTEGQKFGSSCGAAVALGNLDGIDGLDAFIANSGQAAKMWQKNRQPVIAEGKSKSVYMDQNGVPTPFSLTLNASDPDNAENPNRQALTWRISSPAANGTADVSGTGTVKNIGYAPAENFTGTDKFTVEISDGLDTAVIDITVGVGIGLPQIMKESQGEPIKDVTVEIDEDASDQDFRLTLYAVNPSDTYDTLTWSIRNPARNGTAGLRDTDTGTVQNFSYIPNADFNGRDSFEVVVTNTKGGTASAIVIVVVNSINDPPQITGQKYFAIRKGLSLTFTKYDLLVTDPDHYWGDLTLMVSEGGGYQYYKSGYTAVPASDFVGKFKVPVKISDGKTESMEFELVIAVCPPGDANGSGASDVADVTLMLQLLSGQNLGGVFIKANIGDAGGDGKIGLEDAGFILYNLKKSK